MDNNENPGVTTTKTPDVPVNKNPGVPPTDANAAVLDNDDVPDDAVDAPPMPVMYGKGRYPAHERSEIPQATTNFDLNPTTQLHEHMHASVDQGYNNPAASMCGSNPIHPTTVTLPTHHKALQELMHCRMDLNT